MSLKGAMDDGGVRGDVEGGRALVEEDEEEQGGGPAWTVCGLTDLLPSLLAG